jgi:hypothetical protein
MNFDQAWGDWRYMPSVWEVSPSPDLGLAYCNPNRRGLCAGVPTSKPWATLVVNSTLVPMTS